MKLHQYTVDNISLSALRVNSELIREHIKAARSARFNLHLRKEEREAIEKVLVWADTASREVARLFPREQEARDAS